MSPAVALRCCSVPHHVMKLPMATNADSSRIHHWKAEPARPLHSSVEPAAAAAAAGRHDSYQQQPTYGKQHAVPASLLLLDGTPLEASCWLHMIQQARSCNSPCDQSLGFRHADSGRLRPLLQPAPATCTSSHAAHSDYMCCCCCCCASCCSLLAVAHG
jgi:hypothetical protein